jgi:hypothetical protein
MSGVSVVTTQPKSNVPVNLDDIESKLGSSNQEDTLGGLSASARAALGNGKRFPCMAAHRGAIQQFQQNTAKAARGALELHSISMVF